MHYFCPITACEFDNRTSNIVHRQTHFLMRLPWGCLEKTLFHEPWKRKTKEAKLQTGRTYRFQDLGTWLLTRLIRPHQPPRVNPKRNGNYKNSPQKSSKTAHQTYFPNGHAIHKKRQGKCLYSKAEVTSDAWCPLSIYHAIMRAPAGKGTRRRYSTTPARKSQLKNRMCSKKRVSGKFAETDNEGIK